MLVALRRRDPLVSLAFAFATFAFLLIFHLIFQQATNGDFLALSPNQTVIVILLAALLTIGVGVYAKLARRRRVTTY